MENSFVVVISTSSLMPHDCLETFSHFVLRSLLAEPAEKSSVRGIRNYVFHPLKSQV